MHPPIAEFVCKNDKCPGVLDKDGRPRGEEVALEDTPSREWRCFWCRSVLVRSRRIQTKNEYKESDHASS